MSDSDIHRNLFSASRVGDDSRVNELLAAGAEPDKYKDSYYGDTALADAALFGSDSTVSILIQHGADINRQNWEGYTALHWAARGHSEVTTTLMKNHHGSTPLSNSSKNRKNKVVQSLIEAGADLNIQDNDGNTALHCAALGRQNEMMTTLIKAGADINIRNKKGETYLNTTDEDGNTLMHHAAGEGDNEEIITLIEAGTHLNIQNKNKETALHWAASLGHNEVITTFIKAGAHLNIQTSLGSTPLSIAAERGKNKVVQSLIEAGADLNIQGNDGNTALHCAALGRQSKVITALIEAGADLNIRNKKGETPLTLATQRGKNKVVQSLIEAGADLNIQDNDGNTPLTIAARRGQYDVVTTFVDAGAEVPPCLANMMMNKDPSRISSLLDFLSKKLEKFQDRKQKKDDYLRTKSNLGIEILKGEQKMMFYNVPCNDLDGKSLLVYIDSENVRLSRQREELIDLSVKIANLNNRGDTEEAMDEVINQYKSGLPSGVGLRDMIKMIQDRYPWSSSKKKIMIFVSLLACILGIGLFVFDLTSDLDFSLDMFNKENKSSNETENVHSYLSKNENKFNISSPDSLNSACDAYINFYKKLQQKIDHHQK